MIYSKSGGVIRLVQKYIAQDDILVMYDRFINLVPGIPGKVLQAVNCTVQCDPNQTVAYDNTVYVFSNSPEVPQMIWLGFNTQGYSILSQSITADIGNSLTAGRPLDIGFPLQNPTQGDGGMWVSLWYTIWPDKSGAF